MTLFIFLSLNHYTYSGENASLLEEFERVLRSKMYKTHPCSDITDIIDTSLLTRTPASRGSPLSFFLLFMKCSCQ